MKSWAKKGHFGTDTNYTQKPYTYILKT